MRIARFRFGNRTAHGVVFDDEIAEIRGSIYTSFRITDTRHPLAEVRLLPPTDAGELWGPGLNFVDHLEYAGSVFGQEAMPVPEKPQPWRKGRNALTGVNDPIIIPSDAAGEVHYEGEAVAVIGKVCRRIPPGTGRQLYPRLYLRQRRQRTGLAEGRLDFLAGQGRRHLRPGWPLD